MGKGQAAIELMIILGVALAVLLFILSFSNEQIADINQDRQLKTAQTAANEIVSAANDVYFQGTGARKKVFYEVPSGIDEAQSGIENQTVVFKVLGSDVFAQAKVQISGSLPTGPGGHWVWLESKEGYVSIGIEYVSLSESAIYKVMGQDTNANKTITVTNDYSGNAQVVIELTWSHSDVTLSISDSGFLVNASSTSNVDFNFSAGESASGTYSGETQFNISYNGSDQNIIVPITVEIAPGGGGGGTPTADNNIRIFPTTDSIITLSGDANSGSFQICNVGESTILNVAFTNSSGDAGDWIGPIATITSFPGDSCKDKIYTVTVPGGTAENDYTGTIIAASGTHSDSIEITVTVPKVQANNFSFSWSPAFFSGGGDKLEDWNFSNFGDSTITISRMRVCGWSTNDQDNATLKKIKIDDDELWSGTANDCDWVDITDFPIAAGVSYSNKNKLEFNGKVNDDGEQFYIEFEFSDNSTYTTTVWPIYYTVDLWEFSSDLPQPLDWSNDINSSANTFGAGAGNDGWDWEDGVYDFGSTCVRFNADPNDDNSSADSTVGSQNRLRIQIGDYQNQCNNDGHGSGAYGIQFEISSEMHSIISGGGTATLEFTWVFDDHSLDNGDAGWLKARFGNASGMNYLGTNVGGTGDDATPELVYNRNPNDHTGSESIDVASYITAAGTYYLELGGKVSDWENNEWLEAEFDNLNLIIEE